MTEEIKWNQTGGAPPEMVRNISEEYGFGGGALLLGGPSWIRSPPELGAEKLHIQKQGWIKMRCPVCKEGDTVYVILLEKDLCVSCCSLCGKYGWIRNPGLKKDEK
jgi:hypothetical protein